MFYLKEFPADASDTNVAGRVPLWSYWRSGGPHLTRNVPQRNCVKQPPGVLTWTLRLKILQTLIIVTPTKLWIFISDAVTGFLTNLFCHCNFWLLQFVFCKFLYYTWLSRTRFGSRSTRHLHAEHGAVVTWSRSSGCWIQKSTLTPVTMIGERHCTRWELPAALVMACNH